MLKDDLSAKGRAKVPKKKVPKDSSWVGVGRAFATCYVRVYEFEMLCNTSNVLD